MVDHIVLNSGLWVHCDFASVSRVIHHWTTAALPTFSSAIVERWPVRRLLANFHLFFLRKEGVEGVISFADYFSKQETLHCRDLYLNFVIAVGSISLIADDAEVLYSYLTEAEDAEIVLFMRLIVQFGPAIEAISDLSFNPFTPLQKFFDRFSADIVVETLFAVARVSRKHVHYYLLLLLHSFRRTFSTILSLRFWLTESKRISSKR
jgi:hypothetical protein